ncbi:hypothetical protein QGM71_05645 [Virgibacillus sp. C22-A2]|uniref:Uncharacterized protein n=1 Tax=Virgibacillus tibetensis TaxID=3042313 RepID=A0ABU6KD40_9BACI|nr:hypothetical protein [Virgibacillus sp. C22-A2]
MATRIGNRQAAIAEVFLQSVWKKEEFQKVPVALKKFSEIVEQDS